MTQRTTEITEEEFADIADHLDECKEAIDRLKIAVEAESMDEGRGFEYERMDHYETAMKRIEQAIEAIETEAERYE